MATMVSPSIPTKSFGLVVYNGRAVSERLVDGSVEIAP